jgi:HlyD family secretion protein
MKRAIVWVVGLAAVAWGLAVIVRPQPVEVETAVSVRGDVETYITEEAETRLDDEYVITMPVQGRLLRIDLKEGAAVRKGDVIARVDTFEREEELKRLAARVEEIKALIEGVDEAKPKPEDIRTAELAVEEAKLRQEAARKAREACEVDFGQEKKKYLRNKELLAKEAINEFEFIESERRYLVLETKCKEAKLTEDAMGNLLDQARVKLKRLRESVDDNEYQRKMHRAQIAQIEARRATLKDEIAKSSVAAPVAGPILERYQESEQVLIAGTPLLKMGDMTSLRVESDVLSEEVVDVRAGQSVEIFGPAVGARPLAGTVERIYPAGFEKISSLGIEQQRVKVIIAFESDHNGLRPGTRLDVRIVTGRKAGVVRVSERALFRSGGTWNVFVVENGVARLAPVELGLRNPDWSEATSGLAEGVVVVLNPPPDLENRTRVRSAGPAAPAQETPPN